MFLNYGAVRGIWLSKMSERERRDVLLKGARDLARAKLDQARATEREAQAKSLKPAGSVLPPAVQENGKAYLRTRPNAGWRAKASGDMIESKPVDSLFASWSDAQGRVSPQHVADKLQIERRAAKKNSSGRSSAGSPRRAAKWLVRGRFSPAAHIGLVRNSSPIRATNTSLLLSDPYHAPTSRPRTETA